MQKEYSANIINDALNAKLYMKDLPSSMNCLDCKYRFAGFIDEIKPGFRRVSVIKFPSLSSFAMYYGDASNKELLPAVKDFRSGTQSFRHCILDVSKSNSELFDKKNIVNRLARPDAHVGNKMLKIDTATIQLPNSTIFMKKVHPTSKPEENGGRVDQAAENGGG